MAPALDRGAARLERAGAFLLVIGGIYLGWFSPTEAAAVGAAGAFAVALVSGAVDKTMLRESVAETAALTGMIFFILIGAGFFNYFLESTGVPSLLKIPVSDRPPSSS